MFARTQGFGVDEKRGTEWVDDLQTRSETGHLTVITRSRPQSSLRIVIILALIFVTVGYYTFLTKECFQFAHAFLSKIWNANSRATQIAWSNCGDNLECGRFEVPLDYFDETAGKASLSVVRYLATDKTSKLGSLFTNPGGPGGSGVGFVQSAGEKISKIVSGRYDIVSWDPRGINGTLPRIDCFASQIEQDIATANTHNEVPYEFRNLSDPLDFAVFKDNARLADARNKMLVSACEERSGDTGKHVSTATVVRDLVTLHDSLHGTDEPINYWGFSYGTIVGSYFVNMFPDRVGKVIIDGVVNPDTWANVRNVYWKHDFFVDTEKVLSNFFSECAEAGPSYCPLATKMEAKASDLARDIDGLIDELYEHPLAVHDAKRPSILTSSMIKSLLFRYMYRPREWRQLAEFLASAKAGNGTAIVEIFLKDIKQDIRNPPAYPSTIGAQAAIMCTDSPDYAGQSNDEAFETLVESSARFQRETSLHFGGLNGFSQLCHHVNVRAVERFAGPFNHTLSNEIIIIGNTADPVTPLNNAVAVNKMMGNSSRLIIHDGSGHCSMALASVCTLTSVREYLLDGKLPPNELTCSIDEKIFAEPTTGGSPRKDWLKEESAVQLSEESLSLLEAGRSIGNELASFSLTL